MSPMGSGGRGNYSSQSASLSLAKGLQSQSPSLAKRGLQIRQQQDAIAPCHKNIWPNPMQGLPGVDIFNTLLFPDDRDAFEFPGQDISYLHSLQAQSFPHIPKNQLAQLADSTKMDKMDIYENPSEHYASINNYGIAGTVECSSHLEDGNRKLVWTVLTNFDFQASPDRAC